MRQKRPRALIIGSSGVHHIRTKKIWSQFCTEHLGAVRMSYAPLSGEREGFRLLPPIQFLTHSGKGRLLLLCCKQGHHTDTSFPKGNARVRRSRWRRDEGRADFQFSLFQKWQNYFPEKENIGDTKTKRAAQMPYLSSTNHTIKGQEWLEVCNWTAALNMAFTVLQCLGGDKLKSRHWREVKFWKRAEKLVLPLIIIMRSERLQTEHSSLEKPRCTIWK